MSPPRRQPWHARWDLDRPVYAVPVAAGVEIIVDGVVLEREPERVVQLHLTPREAVALAWALVRLIDKHVRRK